MVTAYTILSDREEEELYDKLLNLAKNVCGKILYNKTDIEDVAHNTLFKFYQNRDKIENIFGWVKVVARREAIIKIKSNKNISIVKKDIKNRAITPEIHWGNEEIELEDNSVSLSEAKKLLSKEDFKIYQMIIDKDYEISDIVKKLNISHQAAKTKIYKTKRNLKAAKLTSIGYIGTKAIIDYQTNKNIIKFINTLKVKLNNNDLKSLRKYFINYDVTKIEIINIIKTFEYEIEKVKDKFHICIPYLSSNGKVEFMQVSIFIDIKNRIRVEKLICRSENVIKKIKPIEDVIDKLPKPKKGIIPIKIIETDLLNE